MTEIEETRVTYFFESTSVQVKIQFRPFLRSNQIFEFPCCNTRESLSSHVSFTTVGLKLTNLG